MSSDVHQVSLLGMGLARIGMSGGEYLRGEEDGYPVLTPPKHIRLASERYASYWNAFLLSHVTISR